jgi:hypothetical protein
MIKQNSGGAIALDGFANLKQMAFKSQNERMNSLESPMNISPWSIRQGLKFFLKHHPFMSGLF